MLLVKSLIAAFLFVFILPIAASAALYWFGSSSPDWRSADRSSAGLLPAAAANPSATVRIFAARTVRWRGILAVHSWIVVKDAEAENYDRYDYTAWGEPIRVNGFVADGRWFGEEPQLVFAADGEEAARLIPLIREAVRRFRFSKLGDYRAWPGPNSNTFVAAVIDEVPGLAAVLPPNAIGKDFPYDGNWLSPTPSGGFRLRLGGYGGITVGWFEGIEINVLGAVAGIDVRRPAIKLPGFGRLGIAQAAG